MLRDSGIQNEQIIQYVLELPLEEFRPWEIQPSPAWVAGVAESLDIDRTHKVLEIGTGTGCLTALLSRLAGHVYSFEIREVFSMYAKATLERIQREDNVTLFWADGSCGYPAEAPYDRICVSASAAEVPRPLLDQLVDGGKLLMGLNSPRGQELALITKVGHAYQKQVIGPSQLMRLVGKCAIAADPPERRS